MKYILLFLFAISLSATATESECFGTPSNGSLKNGVELPSSGINFETYSHIARLAGRTYVHSKVREIVVAAYVRLESEQPDKRFKYAETGFKEGGPFKPHKTHRNGLSVDFMVPVLDNSGNSVHLPTNPTNKFGYNIEFDAYGKYEDYVIDYEAMAAHITLLHKEAKAKGHNLWRVIFAPELQPNLFKTQYGKYLQENVNFLKTQSWVRHDEHYHVDFAIPCH